MKSEIDKAKVIEDKGDKFSNVEERRLKNLQITRNRLCMTRDLISDIHAENLLRLERTKHYSRD